MERKINSKVTFTVMEGKIKEISNGHGLCYKVRLPRKDFKEARDIWIDESEIVNLYKVQCDKNVLYIYSQSKEQAEEHAQIFLGKADICKATLVRIKAGTIVALDKSISKSL